MAGRLVCQNCGLAAGSRAVRSVARSTGRSNRKLWRVIPKGATITNTTCESIDVGASSRYQCTITYSP